MTEELATKVTQTFLRDDGAEVKIVATAYFGRGDHQSIGVDVFRRPDPDATFELCNDRPHPDWRTMSVDEYRQRGRSEKLQAASPAEILSVVSLIGKPISFFAAPADDVPEEPASSFRP